MATLDSVQIQLLNKLQQLIEPVSSQTLANSLSVSSKTVRNRMKELEKVLQHNGGTIRFKSGTGCWLEVQDKEKLEAFLQALTQENPAMDFGLVQLERVHRVILHLLCQEDYIKTEELVDLLYLNHTTVKKLLIRAGEILQIFGLQIIPRSRNGIKIDGDEHNLRLCFVHEINQLKYAAFSCAEREEYAAIYSLSREKAKAIRDIVCQNLGKENNLSEYSVEYLTGLVWVSAVRGGAGYKLSYNEEIITRFGNGVLHSSVCRVLEKCGELLDCQFSARDAVLLSMAVTGFQVILEPKKMPAEQYKRGYQMAADLIRELVRINGFQMMDKDDLLPKHLALHLPGALMRAQFHIHTLQFSGWNGGECSLMAKKLAMQSAEYIEEKYGVALDEEEILRLAMVIRPVFGRLPRMVHQVRACIISRTDKTVGRGMAERLQRNFSRFFFQVDMLEPYELRNAEPGYYRVIFSDYSARELKYLPKGAEVIRVTPSFGENDKLRIRQRLVNICANGVRDHSFLEMRRVFVDVEAHDRKEALEQVEGLLGKEVRIRGNLTKDLLRCEELLGSSPKETVVIVSGLESHTEEVTTAILVLKRPIPWGEMGQKAQVVVYWDRGQKAEDAASFENEFVPQLLESALYNKAVVEALVKGENSTLLLESVRKSNKRILSTVTSF